MKPIVAYIDFSDATASVVAQAEFFSRALHAPVILLHAMTRQPEMVDLGLVSPVYMRQPTVEECSDREAQLHAIRDMLVAKGIETSMEVVPEATVDRMVSVLWGVHACLAILGAHDHSLWYELFVGSATRGILKGAPCPVLVVPSSMALCELQALKVLSA